MIHRLDPPIPVTVTSETLPAGVEVRSRKAWAYAAATLVDAAERVMRVQMLDDMNQLRDKATGEPRKRDLRDDIRIVRQLIEIGMVPRSDRLSATMVCDAAESTLPKVKILWQLTGWTGDKQMPAQLVCGYDHRGDAEAEALRWLRKGGSVTSLRQVEVPTD